MLLDLTHGKTNGIVDTGIVEKICRQKEALQAIVGSTEELKREVEESKLENGESLDKVKEWGQEIEERIDIVDNEIKDPFSLTVMHRGRFVVSGTQKVAIRVSSFSGGEIRFHLNSLFML